MARGGGGAGGGGGGGSTGSGGNHNNSKLAGRNRKRKLRKRRKLRKKTTPAERLAGALKRAEAARIAAMTPGEKKIADFQAKRKSLRAAPKKRGRFSTYYTSTGVKIRQGQRSRRDDKYTDGVQI
jgi:hypothetical protein